MIVIATALLICLSPQSPTATAAPLEAFRSLDEDAQQSVIWALDRKILLDPNPLIQDIVSMQRSFKSYPEAEPPSFHDPAKWAKGAAPKRVMIPEGSTRHDDVLARFERPAWLPDLHKAVWYDWGSGRVVRRAAPLTEVEIFENLLNGFPPGSDAAVAHVQEILDRDPTQRPIAAYLQHLYADLEAQVYENVTLYDAWYSGEMIDVPDVDAIPFALQILKTKEYRSPIPAGPRRTALYQEIRDHAFAHRKYRTLREAAAAAFVSAKPILDPMYQPLVPRFQWVFAVKEEKVHEIGEWLGSLPHRQAFIELVDGQMGDDDDWEAVDLREMRQERLEAMVRQMRALATAAVQ